MIEFIKSTFLVHFVLEVFSNLSCILCDVTSYLDTPTLVLFNRHHMIITYPFFNPETCRRPDSGRSTEKAFAVDREHSFSCIQTTFYNFLINQKLKVYQVSFIVQNFASKNKPHILYRKVFFNKIEE